MDSFANGNGMSLSGGFQKVKICKWIIFIGKNENESMEMEMDSFANENEMSFSGEIQKMRICKWIMDSFARKWFSMQLEIYSFPQNHLLENEMEMSLAPPLPSVQMRGGVWRDDYF